MPTKTRTKLRVTTPQDREQAGYALCFLARHPHAHLLLTGEDGIPHLLWNKDHRKLREGAYEYLIAEGYVRIEQQISPTLSTCTLTLEGRKMAETLLSGQSRFRQLSLDWPSSEKEGGKGETRID